MPSNPYMDAFEQFSAMAQPDPNTFLKLIWPHLDRNTRYLIGALLTPPATAASPDGQAQPVAAPATRERPLDEMTPDGTVKAPNGGTFGGPQPGQGAKVVDPKLAPETSKGTTVAPGQKRRATLGFEEMGPDGKPTTRLLDIF